MNRAPNPLVDFPGIQLPANAAALDSVHEYISEFWRVYEDTTGTLPDDSWRDLFVTAITEIVTNIIRHAYGNQNPEGFGLALRAFSEEIHAAFEDRGIQWECELVPMLPVGGDVMELPEGGFGLHIVRSAVNEIRYWRTPHGSNKWLLVKQVT